MLRIFVWTMVLSVPVSAQLAPKRPLRALSSAIQELAEAVGPSIVQVSTHGFADGDSTDMNVRATSGVGSGFIVDPDGYILTNAHVVGTARKVEVLLQRTRKDLSNYRSAVRPAGRIVSATVVGTDQETDIAVLKVEEKGLPTLKLGNSEAVRQGDLAIAAGSPFGLENSVSMGIISSVARQLQPDGPMIYLQTDAPINPGNSGGPLIDADGEVIGVNTMILSPSGASDGVGFSVPSNIARTVFEQIRKDGRVRRGYIGVRAQTITPAFVKALGLKEESGVILADVAPGGAAAAAQLEVKDIILTLDGKKLENARQFGVAIYRHPGKTVTLEIARGTEKMMKVVAVLERPRDLNRLSGSIDVDTNRVLPLRVFAVNLDEKVTPILPDTRKLAGAVVAGVISPPQWGGDSFLPGDVIYELNGKPITGVQDLMRMAAEFTTGQVVVAHVERAGQLQFLTLRAD